MQITILFVCHANVARSQMAKAIARIYAPKDRFASAGTEVDRPGETLGALRERGGGHNPFVIGAMKRIGIDVSKARRQQLTPESPSRFDLVVSMLDEKLAPSYLLESPNYVRWDVPDPARFDASATSQTAEEIEIMVLEMLATIEACELNFARS